MQRAAAAARKPRRMAKPKPYQYKACGLDNVFLIGGVELLETPRGKVVQIKDLEGLHRAIGHWLVHEKKNLTGKEFRFLRHEINLTQQNLAALLGTDVQNIGRWERGDGDKVPGPAQAVIRLLYEETINNNPAIKGPLERLAELDEQEDEEDMRFPYGPEGWSAAA